MPRESASASSPPVQHVLALLGDDGGGAGVLAERQDAVGGDLGVLQHRQGDEAVVLGGLGIVEDRGHLLEVGGAQEEGDVVHRLLGQAASAPRARPRGTPGRRTSRPRRGPW